MSRIFLLLIFGVPFYFSDGQSRARGRSVGGWSNRDEMGRETALPVNLVRAVVGDSAVGGRTFFYLSVMLIAVSGGGGGHYGEERDGEKAQKAPDEHKTVGLFTDDYPHCIT